MIRRTGPQDTFVRSERGVVTIEWVVIAAVVLLAALVITSQVLTGAQTLGGSVANKMEDAAAED